MNDSSELDFIKYMNTKYPEFEYCLMNNNISRIDGIILNKSRKVVGIFEFKNRDKPFSYFSSLGSFVVDKSKYESMREMCRLMSVNGYLFNRTRDGVLMAYSPFSGSTETNALVSKKINVYKNDRKQERVDKFLVEIPLTLVTTL